MLRLSTTRIFLALACYYFCCCLEISDAFLMNPKRICTTHTMKIQNESSVSRRKAIVLGSTSGFFVGLFGGGGGDNDVANASSGPTKSSGKKYKSAGPTGEVVKVVNGMKHRRLGGSDILVSELGLGTQRWYVLSLSLYTHIYR